MAACLRAVWSRQSRQTSGASKRRTRGIVQHVPEHPWVSAMPIRSFTPWRECDPGANMGCVQLHGPGLLEAGVPLVDVVVAAVDGERDPRCLLLSFECIQCTAKIHLQAGPESAEARTPSPACAHRLSVLCVWLSVCLLCMGIRVG